MIRCTHHKQSGNRLKICRIKECKGHKEHAIMQKCPDYESIRKCMWAEARHSDRDKPEEKASLRFEPCARKNCDGFDNDSEVLCELHTPEDRRD